MPLDKVLGHGLSLAAEYQHQRKLKATQGEAHVTGNVNRIRSSFNEEDEEEWQLDEIAGHDDSSPSSDEDEMTADSHDELAGRKLGYRHFQCTSGGLEQRGSLSLPVIIPQRRPGNKKRGFVRAYAPALRDCGIDEETFMRFLKDFHKSSQASPWFTVIYLSAVVAGFAPSAIAIAVSMAAQAGAVAGAEVQRRYRTNNFLDEINETLFKPAGLFAMIVTYKPDNSTNALSRNQGHVSISSRVIDMGQDWLTTGLKEGGRNIMDRTTKLQVSSGTTRGAAELPEFAPLVFPDVDTIIQRGEGQTTNSNVKNFLKFFANYMDRRAQISFAEDNPNSSLKLPESERQMRSYSALSKLGEALQSRQGKEVIFQDLIKGGASQPANNSSTKETRKDSIIDRKRVSGHSGSLGVKRMLQQDVLYLTIVNLPSEDELGVARQALDFCI